MQLATSKIIYFYVYQGIIVSVNPFLEVEMKANKKLKVNKQLTTSKSLHFYS